MDLLPRPALLVMKGWDVDETPGAWRRVKALQRQVKRPHLRCLGAAGSVNIHEIGAEVRAVVEGIFTVR